MLTCTINDGEPLQLYRAMLEERNFNVESSADVCKEIIKQTKGKNVVTMVLHNDTENVTRVLDVIYRSGSTNFMEKETSGMLGFFLIEEKEPVTNSENTTQEVV